MERMIERMCPDGCDQIGAIGRELLVWQRLGACDEFARHTASSAPLAVTVLQRQDRSGVPVGQEAGGDTTVVGNVAVEVAGPLPRADGRKMPRLQRRDVPGIHGEV